MIKDGKIKSNLSKFYDLKDASNAHSDLESKKTTGSIILKP